jgi:hypothetical protein
VDPVVAAEQDNQLLLEQEQWDKVMLVVLVVPIPTEVALVAVFPRLEAPELHQLVVMAAQVQLHLFLAQS